MKTIAKALLVLRQFSAARQEWGVTDLGRATGIDKVIVHRILRTLMQDDLVEQDPGSKLYRLGPGVADLAGVYGMRLRPLDVARPYLAMLCQETGETSILATRRGTQLVVAQIHESSQAMRVTATVGERAPLYCTSAGKLFLAFGPPAILEEVLKGGLKRMTPNTITDPTALRRELAHIRERGYAIDDEEIIAHIGGIAAPLRSATGVVEATIAIRGPSARVNKSTYAGIVRCVCTTADKVSRELGYVVAESMAV